MSEYALNLHVALATYPKAQIQRYVDDITKYHQTFRDGTANHFRADFQDSEPGCWAELYQPAVYHIFGNYDVAFISLTHSFKFSQRLFMPKYDKDKEDIEVNSYQILTGLASTGNSELVLNTFAECKDRKFICITNLKFSNGFLIGNGQILTISAIKKLNEKLATKFNANSNWLFFQSLSWFEMSVVFFTDNTDNFSSFLDIVRELSIRELDNHETIITNSLYGTYKDKNAPLDSEKVLPKYHVFSDTQSHIGVEFEYFKTKNVGNMKLKTQIEWTTKPGQLFGLTNALKKGKIRNVFNKKVVSLTGKTDYWFEEKKSDLLSNNQKLFNHLLKNDAGEQHDSIRTFFRNYRTRVLMDSPESKKSGQNANSPYHGVSPLKKLTISHETINNVYDRLRTLKVSRHIRQKINKIFFNYNIGISDPILYIYFLDLHNFVKHLCDIIEAEHGYFISNFIGVKEENREIPKTVFEIESILEKFIRVFSEANTIRGLNGYAFEEIYDFDLDVNSSCQQLLTTYNSIVIALGNELIDGQKHPQVVQLNLHNTESNDVSINYNVYHLINGPEFVLSAIVKEILNSRFTDKSEGNSMNELYTKLFDAFENSTDPLIIDWIKQNLILPDYYLSDAIRVMLVYNFDIELYVYWLWVFNFQNTTLYSTVGVMDERYFKQELFRLVFVVALFDEAAMNKLECPTPELASYWNRHFYAVKTAVTCFFETADIKRDLIIAGIVKFFQKGVLSNNITGLVAFNKYIKGLTDSVLSQYEIKEDNPIKIMFENIGLWHPLHPNIQNRVAMLQIFKENQYNKNEPVIYDESRHHSPTTFLYCMTYSYLKTLYEKNNGQINMLRRSWEDGEPMKHFINESPEDSLFLIDPHGGLFFADFDKKDDYYKIRNAMLKSLWHLSLVLKKEFINKASEAEASQPNT